MTIGLKQHAGSPAAKYQGCVLLQHDRQGGTTVRVGCQPARHPFAQVGLCTIRPAKRKDTGLQRGNKLIKVGFELANTPGTGRRRKRFASSQRTIAKHASPSLDIVGKGRETGSHCDMVIRS
jgi:hypothetical protein